MKTIIEKTVEGFENAISVRMKKAGLLISAQA